MALEGITQNRPDTDLVAGNVKKDVSIFGVVGTFEGGGSFSALQSVALTGGSIKYYQVGNVYIFPYGTTGSTGYVDSSANMRNTIASHLGKTIVSYIEAPAFGPYFIAANGDGSIFFTNGIAGNILSAMILS